MGRPSAQLHYEIRRFGVGSAELAVAPEVHQLLVELGVREGLHQLGAGGALGQGAAAGQELGDLGGPGPAVSIDTGVVVEAEGRHRRRRVLTVLPDLGVVAAGVLDAVTMPEEPAEQPRRPRLVPGVGWQAQHRPRDEEVGVEADAQRLFTAKHGDEFLAEALDSAAVPAEQDTEEQVGAVPRQFRHRGQKLLLRLVRQVDERGVRGVPPAGHRATVLVARLYTDELLIPHLAQAGRHLANLGRRRLQGDLPLVRQCRQRPAVHPGLDTVLAPQVEADDQVGRRSVGRELTETAARVLDDADGKFTGHWVRPSGWSRDEGLQEKWCRWGP